MPYYKIVCMKQFAERLSWAMKCAGYDPARDQSRIAALIGKPCKPQNIQHLLNPDNEVEHSKYTLDLAQVLGCDPFWLGKGTGVKPEMSENSDRPMWRYQQPEIAPLIAARPVATHYLWPFKKFTFEEYNLQDDAIKDSIENVISGIVKNRGDPEKHATPAPTTATGKAA